jgi:Fe-S-cluster containining protein
MSQQNKKEWWSEGLRFQCQGSGNCCTSHGEYGFVYLTPEDRQRMADELGMSLAAFTKKHCERTNGFFHLKEDGKNPDCLFLKDKRCSIYKARPIQCRTWPFWPDAMNAKTWKKEVVTFCPGVGKGPVIPASHIRKQLDEQIESEKASEKEAVQFLKRQGKILQS